MAVRALPRFRVLFVARDEGEVTVQMQTHRHLLRLASSRTPLGHRRIEAIFCRAGIPIRIGGMDAVDARCGRAG